jgi:hypothetical protein
MKLKKYNWKGLINLVLTVLYLLILTMTLVGVFQALWTVTAIPYRYAFSIMILIIVPHFIFLGFMTGTVTKAWQKSLHRLRAIRLRRRMMALAKDRAKKNANEDVESGA